MNKELKQYFTTTAAINVYYLVFVVAIFRILFHSIRVGFAKESWNISEFLINYQGGFVRRGLPGEVVYQFHQLTGISPYYLIIGFCFISLFTLIFLFVSMFIKRGYGLFVLPFVFLIGNPIITGFWVRKDILILLLFLACMYLLKKNSIVRIILFNILFIVGLLSHEAMGFFTFPIAALVLFSSSSFKGVFRRIGSVVLQLFPSIIVFLSVSKFKGNKLVAQQIWNSWDGISFPYHHEGVQLPAKAVGALGWTMEKAFSYPISTLTKFSYGIYAPLALVIMVLIVYYILSNLNVLNYKIGKFKPQGKWNKTIFSSVFIVQLISSIPFLIFGWDYGRILFYWVASSFAIIFAFKDSNLKRIIPVSLDNTVNSINSVLAKIAPPSRGLLTLLCIVIGFSPCSFDLNTSFISSSCYIVLEFLSSFVKFIIH